MCFMRNFSKALIHTHVGIWTMERLYVQENNSPSGRFCLCLNVVKWGLFKVEIFHQVGHYSDVGINTVSANGMAIYSIHTK